MKKLLLLTILLSACAFEQNIYSYKTIDTNKKTVAISAANLSEMHQELKQALIHAGYKLYVKNDNKDSGYTRQTSRYELSDNIRRNNAVTCGLTEDGYSYAISFIDLETSEEVFSMQGKGCYADIMENFTALINNRYKENQEYSDDNTIRTPTIKAGRFTLWGN